VKKQNPRIKTKEQPLTEENGEDVVVRFNLNVLASERARMKQLQKRCERENRLCNLSEILRAGIGALEKLTDDELEEVIGNLKQL
jgi:hypothetical protein